MPVTTDNQLDTNLCLTLDAANNVRPCSVASALDPHHINNLKIQLTTLDKKITFARFAELRAEAVSLYHTRYPNDQTPFDLGLAHYHLPAWVKGLISVDRFNLDRIFVPNFRRVYNEIKVSWDSLLLTDANFQQNARTMFDLQSRRINRYLTEAGSVDYVIKLAPELLNMYGVTELPFLPILLALTNRGDIRSLMGVARINTSGLTQSLTPNNVLTGFVAYPNLIEATWGVENRLVINSNYGVLGSVAASPSAPTTNHTNTPNSTSGARRPMSDRKSELWEMKSYTFDFFAWSNKQILVSSPAEVDEPIYGVELELSTDHTVRQLIDALEPVWVCAKHDGSITGSKRYMFEMVTLPMSYKMHKMLWAKWFTKLDINKFDTSRATSNGMHIHVSRDSFHNKRHMRDFAWFFTSPYSTKFVIDFSERGELNSYCPLPDFNPTSSRLKIRKNILDYLRNLRGVVNTKKSATIEVRLFKGIVSYATVLKNLELVDAVFKWSGEGVPYTANPLVSFLSWLEATCKKHPNKYEALREFLKTMELDDCLSVSKAIYATQGARTKEEAVTALQKTSGLTDAAVDALNKYYGSPFFRWDYKLDCVTLRGPKIPLPNKGMISHLDGQFLKKYNHTPRAA